MQTHVWLLCGGKFRSLKRSPCTFRARLRLLIHAPLPFLPTPSWGSARASHGSCHPTELVAGEEAFGGGGDRFGGPSWQAAGSKTFSWLHQKDGAEGRLSPACAMSPGRWWSGCREMTAEKLCSSAAIPSHQ